MSKIPSSCPKCGCTTAITKARASGPVVVFYDLQSHEIDASYMHDYLCYSGGSILYCHGCGKRLGRADDFEKGDEV